MVNIPAPKSIIKPTFLAEETLRGIMICVLGQNRQSDTEAVTCRYWYQQNTKVRDEIENQYRDQEEATLREAIC